VGPLSAQPQVCARNPASSALELLGLVNARERVFFVYWLGFPALFPAERQ